MGEVVGVGEGGDELEFEGETRVGEGGTVGAVHVVDEVPEVQEEAWKLLPESRYPMPRNIRKS